MRTRTFCGTCHRFPASLFGVADAKRLLATLVAAVALVLLGSSRPAHAAVAVNAQLNDFEGEGGNTQDPYTGQGALVTADAHIWNDLPIFQSSTYTGLVDSTGATNPTTVTVNGDGYSPGATLGTGNYLLEGSRSAGPGTGISGAFTIGGLTPSARYDLYLYGWNQAGTPSQPIGLGNTFNITSGGTGANSNPQSTSGALLTNGVDYTSSTISTTALGKAYVVYHALLSNSSGQITGTYNSLFNGFQLTLLPNKIISLTPVAPGTYGNRLTQSTHPGSDQATFSPNLSDNIIHVTGSGGNYVPGFADPIGGTINGESKFFTEATGWSPASDQEIYALKIRVGNADPTAAQIQSVVADINDPTIGNTGNVTASVVSGQFASIFPGYQILLTASGGTASPEFLGIDFSADAHTPGVTVTGVAAIPEPASATGLLLAAAGLLLRRPPGDGVFMIATQPRSRR
jgi:hypothetical protein